jgi:hypothetical protein
MRLSGEQSAAASRQSCARRRCWSKPAGPAALGPCRFTLHEIDEADADQKERANAGKIMIETNIADATVRWITLQFTGIGN